MKCHYCEKNAIGRGLCRRHYVQASRDGNLQDYQTENGGAHTIERRLLAKYQVTETGCWEWTGHRRKNKFDYGMIWIGDRFRRAHRVSYEIHKGPIPEGLDVLHSCDNPPCINPDHLSVGTRGENCQDAGNKNRLPLNDRHHNTKLSTQDVATIRSSHQTQKLLSQQFKVTQGTISRIIARKRRAKSDV